MPTGLRLGRICVVCALLFLCSRLTAAQGGVDLSLVGSFQSMENAMGEHKYRFGVEISIEGKYRWTTEDAMHGRVDAEGGQFALIESNGNDSQIRISFPSGDRMLMAGPQGRSEWSRSGRAPAGGAQQGTWELKDPATQSTARFTINGREYQLVVVTIQTGTVEAANGQYRFLVDGQLSFSGEYMVNSPDAFSLTLSGQLVGFSRIPGTPRPDPTQIPVDKQPPSQQLAAALHDRGMGFFNAGRPREAVPLLEKAVQVARQVFGDQHEVTAGYANNLARAYYNAAMFPQADEWFRATIQVLVGLYGPGDVKVGQVLLNYGQLLETMGDYVTGEDAYSRAEQILTAAGYPPNGLAVVWISQATLGSAMGRHAEAEAKLSAALRAFEAAEGPNGPSVAVVCNNLGAIMDAQVGRQAEAISWYQRCLAIREAAGKASGRYEYGGVLTNLGNVYRDTENYEMAEKFYRANHEITRQRLGDDHPNMITSWQNLVGLLSDMGRLPEAEEAWKKSLDIQRKWFGDEHPHMTTLWRMGASLSAQQGRWGEAVERTDRARRMARRYMAQILPALPYKNALAWLSGDTLDGPVSYAWLHPDDPAMVSKAWSWWINRKGAAQEALAQVALLERTPTDPALARKVAELQEVRAQLSTLVSVTPGEQEIGTYIADVKALSAREAALARELARSGVLGVAQDWVEPAAVRPGVPSDAVFVDFVRFRPKPFKNLPKDQLPPDHYAAWVVPPGKAPLAFVDLGAAAPIDVCVSRARGLIKAQANDPKTPQPVREALRAAAAALLDPLDKTLAGARRWWISPDDGLWLLPWNALVLADGTYAIEGHEIELRVSARDLLPGATPKARSPGLIAAFPDYALSPEAAVQQTLKLTGKPGRGTLAARMGAWGQPGPASPLPGTLREAQAVRPNLDRWAGAASILRAGPEALEGVVKSVHGPRYLYLATHGGFAMPRSAEGRQAAKQYALHRNPLLRTSVLLAGCDNSFRLAAAAIDDGVLSAIEAAGLDLAGTELVVLSACHTGEGLVQGGDAVASMRQAFQLAGARTVVATLWPIPDAPSADLMTEFCRRLAEGDEPGAALRAAQRHMIAARDPDGVYPLPDSWAAYTVTRR